MKISPQEQLKSKFEIVESSSIFKGAIQRKYDYCAHITIAEMLNWEETYQIIDEVKDLPLEGRARIYLGNT